MLKKTLRPWLLAIGVVPLALTLTGCFGIPGLPSAPNDGGADGVNEDLVEDIIEGSGGGDVDFESGSLPADFPVGDIPLVPGDVGPSMSISDAQAWTVSIYAADEATAKTAPDLLEQAGFNNDSAFAWENDEYLVLILTTEEAGDGKWLVYYQVQTR